MNRPGLKGMKKVKIEIAIELTKDDESNDKIRKYRGLSDDWIDGFRRNND